MLDFIKSKIFKPVALHKLNNGVPFAKACKVKLIDLNAGEASASLSSRPELLDDKGEFEIGAIFTLAETASGAAMTGALLPAMLNARPIVSDASITLHNAKASELMAFAETTKTSNELLKELRNKKKISFSVIVRVIDSLDKKTVADMQVQWHVKLK